MNASRGRRPLPARGLLLAGTLVAGVLPGWWLWPDQPAPLGSREGSEAPRAALDPELARVYQQPEGDLPLPFTAGGGAHFLGGAPVGERWTGDLDVLLERRLVRALVVYSRTHYFLDGVVQRGIAYEAMREFETYLNRQLHTGGRKVQVLMIPVATDQVIPALLAGVGDIALANLTDIPSRRAQVAFSAPVMRDVREIVVTGPGGPELSTLADLAGRRVYVRESSSYYRSLGVLNERFAREGLAPVEVVVVNRYLEDEDLLEMVNAGLIPAIVVDSHIAQLWQRALDGLVLHQGLALREHGSIAWALRQDSPKLKALVDKFLAGHRKGTLFGNILFRRYLEQDRYIKNHLSLAERPKLRQSMAYFQEYGERYGFDWTLLAAQAYQESGIDQSRRSHTGAVGVMQVLRSTAADRNVAIAGIEQLENNIHAGVKYLRFITDRYLADENITEFNRILLALAGYNVGPGRLARLREEAKKAAKDPNAWFDNVEIIAARRVGREPVQYVSNILKYWVSYELLMDREPLVSLVEPEAAPPSAPCRCGVDSGECPRCRG